MRIDPYFPNSSVNMISQFQILKYDKIWKYFLWLSRQWTTYKIKRGMSWTGRNTMCLWILKNLLIGKGTSNEKLIWLLLPLRRYNAMELIPFLPGLRIKEEKFKSKWPLNASLGGVSGLLYFTKVDL